MKLQEFINRLNSIKKSLKDKEIEIIAPNGLAFEPKVMFVLKDKYDVLNICEENVEKLVISYD